MKTGLMILFLVFGFTQFTCAQTEEDKKVILQQCIDLPALQPYLHPENPARLPLIIENSGKIPVASLSKFGQPVKYMTEDEIASAGTEAVIEFIRFEVMPASATVIYRYNIEGLMITVLFKKFNSVWSITDSKVAER